jgi:diguanylate cyclase (GGDEF)-like protein
VGDGRALPAEGALHRVRAVLAGGLRRAGIWLLTLTLAIAAAVAMGFVIAPMAPLSAPFRIDLWLLAVLFAAVEVFYVQMQFRRESLAFSLSEIPLVLGLYFGRPIDIILGQLVGVSLALWFHRRQPPVKVAFNLANLTLAASVALVVFHAILGGGQPLGISGWSGAIAAAVAADIVAIGGIACAMWVTTGNPPHLSQLFSSGSVATFFNAALGLVGVVVIWTTPTATWLLGVLAGVLLLAYRAYGGMLRKTDALAFLYETTRATQQASELGASLEEVLRQARTMFRAEFAEILLFEDSTVATRSTDDGTKLELLVEMVPVATEGVWARAAAEEHGLVLTRPIADARLREHFAARGVRDLMIGALRAQDAVVGTIMVANRRSDVESFDREQLRLLETFANHASASIQNAGLIDRLRRQAMESEHSAMHDSLTGLPNRTLFRQRLEATLRRPSAGGRRAAVLMMDLNRFKEVNDTLGHRNGDRLLIEVARRLGDIIDEGMLARLSGDEFAVLLAGADEGAAIGMAHRIGKSLHQAFVIDELTLEIGASIGVALMPEHGTDADTLMRRADVAMYLAKEADTVYEVYDAKRDEYSFDRLALVPQLRRAIEGDELIVAYQPIVDVRTGRVDGAEALVRWAHPHHGVLAPDAFIPLAEHTGLIRLLTRAVLRRALADCRRWRDMGLELTVAVNCSARDFATDSLPDEIAALLREFDLPGSTLEVEITESAIMDDPIRSEGVLRQLTAIGVSIAVDDFGTGYSSLAYLKRLDVAQLKVDRSFVTGMTRDAKDLAIVRSVIELGHNLGLKTVAEGVEEEGTLKALSELGCDHAQGYYFGRPMSSQDLVAVAKTSVDGAIPLAAGGSDADQSPGLRLLVNSRRVSAPRLARNRDRRASQVS